MHGKRSAGLLLCLLLLTAATGAWAETPVLRPTVDAGVAATADAAPPSAGATGTGAVADDPATERIAVPNLRDSRPPGSPPDGDEGFTTARRFNFERFRSQAESHWFKRKALLQKNLRDAAAEELDSLRALCDEMGVRRLTPIAAALVHEGNTLLREGSFEKARGSYDAALAFAPDFPAAHRGLARVAWGSGAGTMRTVGFMASALAASAKEGWLGFRTLANGLLIGLLAAWALSACFGLTIMLRHQRSFRHDVEERLAARASPEAASLTALALLFLPLLSWVLAPWTPAWWMAVHFRFCKPREKAISIVLLVFLALSGPAGRLCWSVARLAGDPTARLLLDTAGDSHEPEAILALEELAAASPSDPLYPSLLGSLYARGRFLGEAMDQFTRASEIAPSDPRPPTNIGNLYFELGRHAEASQAYRRAIEADAAFIPAYINLYLARQAMFDFQKAEEALSQARAVDPGGVSELLEGRRGAAPEPIEAAVPRAEIWKRILSRGAWQGAAGASIWSALRTPASVAGLACLLIALLTLLSPADGRARQCLQCGRPFCPRCQSCSDDPDHCMPCRFLLERREGLHPSVRAEKVAEIGRHAARAARLARAASLVLPGSGWILRDRTLAGSLLLLLWCLLGMRLAMEGRLFVPALAPPGGPLLLGLLVALAALVWVAGNTPWRRAAR